MERNRIVFDTEDESLLSPCGCFHHDRKVRAWLIAIDLDSLHSTKLRYLHTLGYMEVSAKVLNCLIQFNPKTMQVYTWYVGLSAQLYIL